MSDLNKPLYFSYCSPATAEAVLDAYVKAGYVSQSPSSDIEYAVGVFTTVEGNVFITDSLEGLDDYTIVEPNEVPKK